MADAPVSEIPAVADRRALRLAIMRALLAVTLLLWSIPGGRTYNVRGGIQLYFSIASHNNAVLVLTLADPSHHNLLFEPSSRFVEFLGISRQLAST